LLNNFSVIRGLAERANQAGKMLRTPIRMQVTQAAIQLPMRAVIWTPASAISAAIFKRQSVSYTVK
jgi:hypothetical protein